MGDAAQFGSLDHEVFRAPYKVEPVIETWKTPGNYRRFPGGDKLPDTQQVWKVQNTGKRSGGVVSRSYGFTDSPDAEAIVAGYNEGKEYGAVGVGRHASFLQWGYSAPPSQMTEAGRKFFVNCICYIRKFDGKAPLVTSRGYPRENAERLAALINRIKDKDFFSRTFSPELKEKYANDPDGLAAYYRENFELIYHDKVFQVDAELQTLGIESNRRVETLERLIALLDDPRPGRASAEAAGSLYSRHVRHPRGVARLVRREPRPVLLQRLRRIQVPDRAGRISGDEDKRELRSKDPPNGGQTSCKPKPKEVIEHR
jgi:hypothetical protein